MSNPVDPQGVGPVLGDSVVTRGKATDKYANSTTIPLAQRLAPPVNWPGDVAALRLYLADAMADGRPLAQAWNAADEIMAGDIMRVPGARKPNEWWHAALKDARLYYFGDDVVDLMQEVASSVPDVKLNTELVPVEDGMIVFSKTWYGKGADGSGVVPIDAIVWSPTVVPTTPKPSVDRLGAAVSIGLLRRIVFPDGSSFWTPAGRTDWVYGWNLADHAEMDNTVISETGEADALNEDRRILLAAWTIITQPGLSTQTDEVSKAGAKAVRRASKKGKRSSAIDTPTVRVIYLPEHHVSSSEATGTGTKLDHRVYVAPFWRQQPYGPNSSLRKPVLVRGHIRGPEGTPLVRREVVRAKIIP